MDAYQLQVVNRLVGIVLIYDGVWSLVTPRNRHDWVTDLGRLVRIGLGVYLIWIN